MLAAAVPLRFRPLRRDQLTHFGRAASERQEMYSDSRKAQRNSFAHHRADLLFSVKRAFAGDTREWAATAHDGAETAPCDPALVQHVRAILLGAARSGATVPA